MSDHPVNIGIAGYMGAGKSTCARILAERLGAGVIDADAVAKELMNGDAAIRERLAAAFGSSVVKDGTVSFEALGAIVFSAKEKLAVLNEIVHPPLVRRLEELLNVKRDVPGILDAALLPLWRDVEDRFDVLLWVETAFEKRLARLADKRPGIGKSSHRSRMLLQEKMLPAPEGRRWIRVLNEGSVEALAAAVVESVG
jgi:dephospho-CoA kinase